MYAFTYSFYWKLWVSIVLESCHQIEYTPFEFNAMNSIKVRGIFPFK